MKLRLHENSIRLRVTQSEVATLAAGGRLEEWVEFTPSAADRLGYAIEVSSGCSEVRAAYSDGVIVVTLPANLTRTWASTNQVGIEHARASPDGKALKIVVEKDFQCIHPRPNEDQSDNYPNPGERTRA